METSRDFGLVVVEPDSDASRLQRLTREIAVSLGQRQDVRARILESETRQGAKGDPITIGAIVLTLIGSGGVVKSLVEVLRAWVDRKPTLKIEITRADGGKATVSAENLAPAQMESLCDFLKS
jgi:hypothetical protein